MNVRMTLGIMVLLVGTSIVPAASGQAEPKADPIEAIDPIAKELEQVRKMLTNAQAKMNRNAVGIESTNSGEPSTPARRCCSGNLEHIDNGLKKIRDLVRERGVCLEQRRDVEGVEVINLVNRDVRSLTNAVKLFADAKDPNGTQSALHNCTRAYLNLLRTVDSLNAMPGSKACAAGG